MIQHICAKDIAGQSANLRSSPYGPSTKIGWGPKKGPVTTLVYRIHAAGRTEKVQEILQLLNPILYMTQHTSAKDIAGQSPNLRSSLAHGPSIKIVWGPKKGPITHRSMVTGQVTTPGGMHVGKTKQFQEISQPLTNAINSITLSSSGNITC